MRIICGFVPLKIKEGRSEERERRERKQEGVRLGSVWTDMARIYSPGEWGVSG